MNAYCSMQNILSSISAQLTAPNLIAVLYLVLLEGILSVDNALALAALVRSRLPNPEDQKRALHYGIIGAYVFRVIVIFAGVWLMSHEWVQWGAAAYLIYLGVSELFFKRSEPGDGEPEALGIKVSFLSPLWSAVVAVELMDIMFSVDSIAVALSVSNLAWVLIAGAVLGILAMRFTAQVFIRLIAKYPILEKTAFVLVLMAGLKIVAKLLHFDIEEAWFMGAMFAVIGGSIGLHYLLPRKQEAK